VPRATPREVSDDSPVEALTALATPKSVIHVGIGHRLFRRHVGRGAQGDAQGGQRRLAGRGADGLGDAKVGDHGVLPREEHVVRLDIAMDHAFGVSVGQRVRHLAQNPHRFAHRQLPLAGQLGAQRLALDERHDVVEEIAGRPRGQ